ncbi:Allantoicase [Friedmanniomyces endolithicus]|uniref:Allantoicase n=1 Tax=Friedmanniomyces endolithicus TaxID=329885 RepID=A0AAN6JHR0_9PEZI|nr:Allantoicase [Friedmanniomyces endolithicus]KAK0300365.1 Allantoicase [Friedmanniomyces endolithicus]KAK0314869.1 Allantoicase [Friedmanniomyces endolithicus]KAK0324833.1 Allantoicase [Friedmanniomyces endolithicus]KAK0831117.1 Allantoicase [Friedmanniomyces endolithicus]
MEPDEGDIANGHDEADAVGEQLPSPRKLPDDLPRDLWAAKRPTADTQAPQSWDDPWQQQEQFITAPTAAKPFSLALNEPDSGDAFDRDFGNDDARVAEMLAARVRKVNEADVVETEEEDVLQDDKLSREQKALALQDFLFMAASNGDAQRVQRLVRGRASDLIELNAVDAEGTPPLVYASCFGHKEVVQALLNAGATVDTQDRNQWTALMWAMTNRHKEIAKTLLDHGASTDVKSSSGRTALDFVPPDSEISDFLQDSGYSIGNAGVSEDFYDTAFSQERFEEELAESEMRRRMMMESAINLEVDLGNLGLDEQPESPEDVEEGQEFVWDRCLNDQMFVFMEDDIERILHIVITSMTPQRSASQKPVPANIVFLGARYALYHANRELLAEWLESAQEKIYAVVDRYQWDMTILAFWISNATMLLYYLKKDPGLAESTVHFQAQMAECIHEIYILIIRDAERRMDKVLDSAMLDHETIPGFEDITFQNEWKFLRTKSKVKPEPVEKRFRPPSPRRKAQISPRNISSLLSSTLFVLDLYDVHSVITSQILSQLYYWLGAEIFNRIMSNKRYLARTKAMQIRMNISTLEDWARTNNRQPEHYENGAMTASGESTMDTSRRHLAPVVQLLQWLQCFSSLGEDREAMVTTLQQLPALSAKQLLHAAKHYRAEVGEKTLGKAATKYIQEVKSRSKAAQNEQPQPLASPSAPQTPVGKIEASTGENGKAPPPPQVQSAAPASLQPDEDDTPESNLMNPALLLPFHLPTSTDMLVTYGSGFGGMNKERERRYVPSVTPEFLAKLDPDGKQSSRIYENARFSDTDST